MSIRNPRRPLCAAIALVLTTGAASAATITVTTGGDAIGTASTCTLRQAIASANNDNAGTSSCVAGSGADTVQFAGALANSTITLTQGQLAISTPVTIAGSNQTIDANYQSRIFQINSTMNAANLTLRHGYPQTPATGYQGGAILAFQSTVSLSNVVLDHNKVASYGGAMQVNHTTLDLTDVTVSNNHSTGMHSGPHTGGGINMNGNCVVTMLRTKITGNSALNGAAMYSSFTTSLIATDSTISGNTAGNAGGAMVTGYSGIVSFIDSTISGNTAPLAGGGLIVAQDTMLYLTNVTMTGNQSAEAGALYIASNAQSALTNTTISGNTAASGGAGLFVKGGTTTIANTIIAGNSSSNAALADIDQITGTLTVTYSLLGAALNTAPFNTAANHNVFSDTPALGPLADNGGGVQTMALLSGSPALKIGSVALALDPAGKPLAYDARGLSFVRTFSGTVDVGAYEAQDDRRFANGFEAAP